MTRAVTNVLGIILPLMLAMLITGLALIVAAGRRGTPFPRCGHCGYDVSGSIGAVPRCPECGRAFAEVGIWPAGRRHHRKLLAAGIVLVFIPVSGCLGLLGFRAAAMRGIQGTTPTGPGPSEVQTAPEAPAEKRPPNQPTGPPKDPGGG